MTEEPSGVSEGSTAPPRSDLSEKVDVAGWGVFFIWVGIAFLADVGIGVGLLGIGVITLGGQLARKGLRVRVERFWVLVGLLFFLGGLWTLLEIDVPLVPLLFIVCGVAVLVSAITGKRWGRRSS